MRLLHLILLLFSELKNICLLFAQETATLSVKNRGGGKSLGNVVGRGRQKQQDSVVSRQLADAFECESDEESSDGEEGKRITSVRVNRTSAHAHT